VLFQRFVIPVRHIGRYCSFELFVEQINFMMKSEFFNAARITGVIAQRDDSSRNLGLYYNMSATSMSIYDNV